MGEPLSLRPACWLHGNRPRYERYMTEFSIKSIHHASLLVADLERSLAFYQDLLGLQLDDSRQIQAYDGAWLRLGNQQIHLLVLPSPDPLEGRPEHVGRDRHLALSVTGLDMLCETLEKAGIPYTRSQSGRRAVFCRDPDKNGLEFVEI